MGEKKNKSLRAQLYTFKTQSIWRTESTDTTFANKCKQNPLKMKPSKTMAARVRHQMFDLSTQHAPELFTPCPLVTANDSPGATTTKLKPKHELNLQGMNL
jgi:hypothetical protein